MHKDKKYPWQMFAAGEGALKTVHFFLYKWGMIGVTNAAPLAFLWTTVVGTIQTIVGIVRSQSSGKTLIISTRHVAGASLFGTVATYMTVLPAWLSSYDEIGPSIFPFMTAVGILPGLLFDFQEGQRRNPFRAVLGIGVFLVGVGAYFDFNFSSSFVSWQMVLAFTFAVAAAINEQIARRTGLGAVDPFIMQFWVGMSTVITCLLFIGGLFGLGLMSLHTIFSITVFYWGLFVLFGVLIVPSIFCKVTAYEEGRGEGSIVSKKVVMLGVLLTLSLLVEWLFFGIDRNLWTTLLFLGSTVLSYKLLDVTK